MGFGNMFSKVLALVGIGAAMQQSGVSNTREVYAPIGDSYSPSYGGCGSFNYAEIQRARRRNYRGKAMRHRSGNQRLARKFSRVKV